jgi:hypothetical protein
LDGTNLGDIQHSNSLLPGNMPLDFQLAGESIFYPKLIFALNKDTFHPLRLRTFLNQLLYRMPVKRKNN